MTQGPLSSWTGRRRRLATLAVLAAWIALLAPLCARFAGKATDDVYISYRYAANLAAGEGLVFNPGERVFGITDPGVALLLAGLHLATGIPLPALGTLATAAAALALALLLLAAARTPGDFAAHAAAGTLLLSSPDLWYGQGAGPIFALAALTGAAALAGERPVAGGLLAGAAVCLRPDAALGVALLAALLLGKGRPLPWRFALAAAAPVIAGLAAAQAYYGQALPNTLAAKRQFAALDPGQLTGLAGFWQPAWSTFVTAEGRVAAGVLVTLALAGLGPLARRAGLPGRVLAGYGVLTAVAYTLLRVPFFVWYLVPVLAAVCYGAAQGAAALVRFGAAARPPALRAAILATLVIAGGGLALYRTAAVWAWYGQAQAGDWRAVAYRAAGEWLAIHAAPGAGVAFDEIGILGYWSRRPVLDLIGLVSLSSMPYAAMGDPVGAFLARPTEYVAFHTFTVRGGTRPIVSKPWFRETYREVARLPVAEPRGEIVIYQRKPGAALPPPRPPRPRPAAPLPTAPV